MHTGVITLNLNFVLWFLKGDLDPCLSPGLRTSLLPLAVASAPAGLAHVPDATLPLLQHMFLPTVLTAVASPVLRLEGTLQERGP